MLDPKRRLALAVCFLAAAVAYISFGPTAIVQEWRLRKARLHVPVIAQALSSDPRFADVSVGTTTASYGALVVHGSVATDRDLQSLRQAIDATRPPVDVLYRVTVAGRPVQGED